MIETVNETGIYRQIQDKDQILEEVIDRVFQDETARDSIDNVILNTAYSEIQRLENSRKTPEEKEELARWRKIYRSMLTMNSQEKAETLKRILNFYSNDIIGKFNPRVYKFTTGLLPSLMSIFFRSVSLKSVVIPAPSAKDIDSIVMLTGKTAELQRLAKIGTVILLPTHLSNMDSIVIGWALYRIGLPPFTYGAGKNLFTNPVLSYFMHNLGAYRVDRRLKHALYKNVLKEYSTVVLERNYHSLFFPGGTRSRSGGVESKLKLGLLGTGIKAYINNLMHNKEKPNIFVVPCTINYHIVLEANTLISDYLKETGKARYIIEDDESSSFAKVFNFLFKTGRLDSSLSIRFGSAFDLFGNKVDAEGTSYDIHGRVVDPKRYVMSNGELTHSEQRDTEYTKGLGEKIVEEFFKNNMVFPTHILAFCLFTFLQKLNPGMDIYRLARLTPEEAILSAKEIYNLIDRIRAELISLYEKGKISIEEKLREQSSAGIIEEALKHFNTYYEKDLVMEKDNVFILNNIEILYYYHNRLKGYNLEKNIF
jgi:glycerol-3-phosphate O-acyltransferase